MDEDEIVSVLPIYYSDVLSPNIHIHQFPLLNRPLLVAPTAVASGKFIKARLKPNSRRLEIHVPVDTRPDVRNLERSRQMGIARLEDDRDKNQDSESRARENEEPRLSEVRLKSEEIPQRAVYVLGTVRNGKLHLHPISESHQLRPTLTYLDVLSRKSKRSRAGESDSDSDDGPPPDPDEPALPPPKKEKKPPGEAKEVHVTARKADDSASLSQGGISAVRREMLHVIRQEDEEKWDSLDFYEAATELSSKTLKSLLSHNDEHLECTANLATFLTSIKGL